MRKIYISDIIPEDELSKWTNGSRVLITGQTGSGKSEFVKNNLYLHCKRTGKKILLLSNRNLLKNQNEIDLEGKEDCIKANNYQELETRILNKTSIEQVFNNYDYVIYDEAHYLFSDSAFNRNTDLLLSPLKQTPKDKVFIFITATPRILLDYQSVFDFKYDTDYDYSYIKDVYVCNKKSTLESIFQNIPYNEKAIYFGSNAYDTWELSTKFLDSSFLCSESNSLYKKADKATYYQIAENSRFENRFLFTTKILDNGINIKDVDVKHIIIDMLDPISFIQCLGRKRILTEKDTIILYVRNYFSGNIYYAINGINSKIKFVEDLNNLSEEGFKEKYRKVKVDEVIDTDLKINEAKYQNYISQKKILEEMVQSPKNGYTKFLSGTKGIVNLTTKSAEEEFEKISMVAILNRYEGVKLFKEEQEKFKAMFFESIFSPKKTDYRKRGLASINAILEEDNVPFIIYSRKGNDADTRNKRYWLVSRIERE